MNIDLKGKSALVTGAGKGIGRAIAVLLSRCGAQVIAVSRTPADLDQLQNETGCQTRAADLTDVDAARHVAEHAGAVDLLVNNAGISIPEPFLKTSAESFDRTMAVNVRAAMTVAQVVAQQMVARGQGGAIVNVSSQASRVGLADHAAYCASKGALDQLTRVMALELGPHQIRVNAVNPTVTLTPMGERAWGDPKKSGPMLAKIPLGRFAKPCDVAHAVVYLLSEQADMIHGAVIPIDGGFLAT